MDLEQLNEEPDWQALCRGLLAQPGVSLVTLAQTTSMSKSGIRRLVHGETAEPKWRAGLRLLKMQKLLSNNQR